MVMCKLFGKLLIPYCLWRVSCNGYLGANIVSQVVQADAMMYRLYFPSERIAHAVYMCVPHKGHNGLLSFNLKL